MARIRWGILGTATIAREAVIPGMRKSPYDECLELVAIASRSLDKAQAVAREFKIPRAYGTYESLLTDPGIDAVYIPLPNHLHVPFAILALSAGKHVLCEKPIGLSVEEAQQLVAAAKGQPHLKLMEAFMYRHHPQWQWAQQVVDTGQIGDLRTIHSMFSFYDDDPKSILHHSEWGGGALMDIGCYSISLARFLFRAEPKRVMGIMEVDPQFGVDRLTSGMLEFGSDRLGFGLASFTCSTCMAPYQRVTIHGTRGRMELEIPFNAPTEQTCRAWLEVDGVPEVKTFEICDQYGIQADLFSRAILNETPVPTPIEDAVENMRTLEALVRSGQQQGWENVSRSESHGPAS